MQDLYFLSLYFALEVNDIYGYGAKNFPVGNINKAQCSL